MKVFVAIALTFAALAAYWYWQPPPPPPSIEPIAASFAEPNDVESDDNTASPISQSYNPAIGLASASDFAERPYFAHWGPKIEMSRVGIRLDKKHLQETYTANLTIDIGLETVPQKLQALWTIDDPRYSDFREPSFAQFNLTPAQEKETIGSFVSIKTNSMTGLPTANPAHRAGVFKIPTALPIEDGLEGTLHFQVSGIRALPHNGSFRDFQKSKFDETYEIRWRIIEGEYLIFLPKISQSGFDGDFRIHRGIDFVSLPNGNFYVVDNQKLIGPFIKILQPYMGNSKHRQLSDDRSEIPEAAKNGYVGWSFYDESNGGWMILRHYEEEDAEYGEVEHELIGPYKEISTKGVIHTGYYNLYFTYKENDLWYDYVNGATSLAD